MTTWIEANGKVLRYELSGSGAAAPLVLVHEMGGMLESWDRVAPVLAKERPVLRFDVRGSGLSEEVRGTLSIDDCADDIAALLDRLGIKGRVAIAGCAVGAAISLHFAYRHAPRVAGLVAMAAATFLPPERRASAFAAAERLERDGLRSSDRAMPEGARFDDPAELLRCKGLANKPHGVAAMWRMLAGLALDAEYPQIACPTLVLAGTRDTYRPPAMVETIAAAIPGAAFRALDTGHVMPVETPELVIEILQGFLGQHRL